MQKKLYGLDHLRAFAIFSVFLFHYQLPFFDHPEWLQDFAKFGWTGVDLFFVLSGFLISSQLFAQIKQGIAVSIKMFFLKRAFRILPLYWLVTAIYFYVPAFREREALPPAWKFLTFMQNFSVDLKNAGTFSHAWSLCVEEHFYLFMPLLLIFFSSVKYFKKSYWLLIALFLFGFIIRIYSWRFFYQPLIDSEYAAVIWYKYIYYPTYNRLDGLLTGVAIACLYQFLPRYWYSISKFANLFLVLGLFLLTGAYFLCINEHDFYASIAGFPLIAVAYGFVVLNAISPSGILYRLKSNITTFIATISYGIYLTHKGVIHITQKIMDNFNSNISSNLLLLICSASCILIAYVLYLIVEKPLMKLRDKVIGIK